MCGRIAIGILLVAGLAAAQAGQGKPTIADQLRGGTANQQVRDQIGLSGMAGPGYIQQGFFDSLGTSLEEKCGKKRGGELLNNLKDSKLKPQEVNDLMNGKMSQSQLANLCGASKSEAGKVDEAVDEAVDDKNQKCFFGILVVIVVCDCKVEDEEFLKQMCKGMEGMDGASADRLMRGDVSTNAIQQCFGFDDKEMCKQMQEALNQLRNSPLVNHPMCESMGIGKKGKYRPEDFPKPQEGMPGCGGEFPGGKAAGLPFDQSLPPLPFAGGNMGFSCCCCAAPPEGCGESGGEPAPAGG